MFGIGGFELFLIILFGFLIFGPDKLPEIAKTVGMAVNKFKKAKDEMDGVIREEVFDPTADEPFKNPAKAIDRAHGVVKEKVARAEHEETFAERKARYDREREERRKRAEIDQQKQAEIDANRAKMRAEAAKKAEAQAQGQAATQAADQAAGEAPSEQANALEAATSKKIQHPTADQLYGNVPMNKDFVRTPKPSTSEAPAPAKSGEAKGESASSSQGGEA